MINGIRIRRECRIACAAVSALLLAATLGFSQTDASKKYKSSVLRRQRYTSWLHPVLDRLGDRFEKPGKEAGSFSGTIRTANSSEKTAITFTLEYPGKITITDSRRGSIVRFDGGGRSSDVLTDQDATLLDSLLFSSVDYFFAALSGPGAMRPIGQQFRYDRTTNARTETRYFDVYELTEQTTRNGALQTSIRLFCFDSFTYDLARVEEPLTNSGTEYFGWQRVQGQLVPSTIVRQHNGQEVFTIEIRHTAFGARSKD